MGTVVVVVFGSIALVGLFVGRVAVGVEMLADDFQIFEIREAVNV